MAKSKYKPKPTWKVVPASQAAASTTIALNAPVRLSQCMIVKNEEENIERALSWGKDIVFEQIVVDTGSTDHTVEIAERMGAKVYHFEWINDFAAAKNYALEKASGNWVAFLDADEYFNEEDTKKILPLLQSEEMKRCSIVAAAMAHLDDNDNIFSVENQMRIFRLHPALRYIEPIHEHLLYLSDAIPHGTYNAVRLITLFHTGYKNSIIKQKDKLQRNITALREQQAMDPDSVTIKSHLADVLILQNGINDPEAKQLTREIALSTPPSCNTDSGFSIAQSKALMRYLVNSIDDKLPEEELLAIYERGVSLYPEMPDYDYYFACYFFNKQAYAQAIPYYLRAQEKCDAFDSPYMQSQFSTFISPLYAALATCYEKTGDMQNAIRYATLNLKLTPNNEYLLFNYIGLLLGKDPLGNAPAVLNVLQQLYDLSKLKNKLLLLKTAKKLRNEVLSSLIYDKFTPEEKAWFEDK